MNKQSGLFIKQITHMDNTKVYAKIERYLVDQFGKKAMIVLDNKITEDEGDVYGVHSIKIIVKEVGDKIYYKPFFKN